MVARHTVRKVNTAIFFVALFCMAFVHANEESLTEEAIRELAETYLENPTLVSGKDLGFYSTYPPNASPYPQNPPPFYQQDPCGCYSNGGPPPSFNPPPMQQQQQQQTMPYSQAPAKTLPLQVPEQPHYPKPQCGGNAKEGYTINFEDISVIQLIQFISKISGTNYIFNSNDLQFNITIVSEDQTSVADLSAALLQILKMHGLSVVEQGNNVLIYKNQNMSKVSTVITDANVNDSCDTAVITRVFQLYNVQAEKIARIVKTLVSPEANVEPSVETRHLIVTDITSNVNRIADLLAALDTPNMAIDVSEYSVQSANAVTLAEYAREILVPLAEGGILTITPEPTSRKIFIVATPFIINKALQVLGSLDVPEITTLNPTPPGASIENNNFYMYKLKYQNGQEIADALREIGTNLQYTGVANLDFVNTIYSVQWLEVNNSIVITGSEEAIDKVLELLEELDQPPKQVYIEVLIIDTTLQNSLDFGVQWVALGDEQNKLAFASGLLNAPPPVSGPFLEGTNTTNPGARFVAATNNPATGSPPIPPNPGRDVPLANPTLLNGLITSNFTSAFGLGFIGNIIRHNGQSFLTLGGLLSALDEEADTSIVLNPRVMVEDTQPANFFVGQNIPYQTTSTVIQQTGSVTQNIQYEDIGVQLQVTPTISPNNIVTLQINQTVATLVTAVGNLTPTTNKTLSTTRVHVPDGTFLVMSGHVFDTQTYIRSGIPCLGTLPLIGPTFSRTIEQRMKRNLIFFIRPKVITNIADGICLTNQQGYEYNWESHPCSLRECDSFKAPECERYPAPPLCPVGAEFPLECSSPPSRSRPLRMRDKYNGDQPGPYNGNGYPVNGDVPKQYSDYAEYQPPQHTNYPPGQYPADDYSNNGYAQDPYSGGSYPINGYVQDPYQSPGGDYYPMGNEPSGYYPADGFPMNGYPQNPYPGDYYPEVQNPGDFYPANLSPDGY